MNEEALITSSIHTTTLKNKKVKDNDVVNEYATTKNDDAELGIVPSKIAVDNAVNITEDARMIVWKFWFR